MSISRDFWERIRQALLMAVDAIEREYDFAPRTAELRRQLKELRRDVRQPEGS